MTQIKRIYANIFNIKIRVNYINLRHPRTHFIKYLLSIK